jgi:hypothetical protein
MLCNICGTNVAEGVKTCPACGHVLKSVARGAATVGGLDLEPEEADDLKGAVLEEEEARPARPARKAPDANPAPAFALDPTGLRKLLAKQPDILEPGLTVYTDKGKPVGVGYSSGVGVIDLLAKDPHGALVVVKVAERGQGEELVAATLQRIGWVRKHLGKNKDKVRGIILVEQAPENLSYTASAMAGTILFKTYRVAVTFEDVEM